jgi:cold shock CspA family protein
MRIDIRISGRPEIVVKRSSKAAKKVPDGKAEIEADVAEKGELDVDETPPARRGVIRRGIREEPIVSLVRRTFDSAQRELKKVVDKQRGEVKTPARAQASGVVERIFRDQSYGFLLTEDGERVYFHRNSVLHGHWDDLTAGTAVRYVPEVGEKGLQASTVDVIQRVGAPERRDVLGELPEVGVKPRSSKPAKR